MNTDPPARLAAKRAGEAGLTFITNEPPTFAKASAGKEANLLNRFKVLIKDARFFDSLVGYFYSKRN